MSIPKLTSKYRIPSISIFYKKQLRIALRNCGFINPENIDEYIARDGYVALGRALTEMTPESVIKEIMDSAAAREGGAFPDRLEMADNP